MKVYKKDSLGDRMKGYESVPKTVLMKRTPVAIRLDGKAFHTFTRGFQKPFDTVLIKTMQETTLDLCSHIQGAVIGYTQSDEITIVLVDYHKLNTSPWFDNEVQKLCSISASMCTMFFNKRFRENIELYDLNDKLKAIHYKAIERGAMFDARCFNIPKEEVTNMILWRQQDCTRNSIQAAGQAYFSHKQLNNKSTKDIQEMLMTEHGINWNNYSTVKKRGTCIVKRDEKWIIDEEIPIFKNEGREYVDKLVIFEDEGETV